MLKIINNRITFSISTDKGKRTVMNQKEKEFIRRIKRALKDYSFIQELIKDMEQENPVKLFPK